MWETAQGATSHVGLLGSLLVLTLLPAALHQGGGRRHHEQSGHCPHLDSRLSAQHPAVAWSSRVIIGTWEGPLPQPASPLLGPWSHGAPAHGAPASPARRRALGTNVLSCPGLSEAMTFRWLSCLHFSETSSDTAQDANLQMFTTGTEHTVPTGGFSMWWEALWHSGSHL